MLPPGSGSAFVSITPIDDTLAEDTETITLTLNPNDLPPGYTLMSGSGTINLYDNDGSGSGSGSGTSSGSISISSASNATEGGSAVSGFYINWNGTTAGTVPLTPSGTATGGGTDYSFSVSGASYNSSTGTLTMGSSSGSAIITITPVDDSIQEDTETITFTLGTPDNGYTVTSGSGTINLFDNDVTPPTVSVQATDGSAWEQGPHQGVFTFARTGSTTTAYWTD